MTVIYLCRVHLQADIDRESTVQRPKIRRPTGYIRKSALPLDEDDDEEVVLNKELGNRRATGFIRKQNVPEDNDEEEEEINEELVEGEADEEGVVKKKKISNRRATGYIRNVQDVPLDEDVEEEANEVDQEVKSPIKTPVNRRRVTPGVRLAPVDDDIGEKSDESIDLKASTKKKAAGFVADEHLEKIRFMSKQAVNRTDSDEERQ